MHFFESYPQAEIDQKCELSTGKWACFGNLSSHRVLKILSVLRKIQVVFSISVLSSRRVLTFLRTEIKDNYMYLLIKISQFSVLSVSLSFLYGVGVFQVYREAEN